MKPGHQYLLEVPHVILMFSRGMNHKAFIKPCTRQPFVQFPPSNSFLSLFCIIKLSSFFSTSVPPLLWRVFRPLPSPKSWFFRPCSHRAFYSFQVRVSCDLGKEEPLSILYLPKLCVMLSISAWRDTTLSHCTIIM